MNIRLKPSTTGAELIHVDQRMKALGIQSDARGNINPDSVGDVLAKDTHGMGAISAVAQDGMLDADGLAQLRKNVSLWDNLRGRDVPISAKKTRAVQALSMEIVGTANALDQAMRQIQFTERVDNPTLLKANERMADFSEKFNAWTKDGVQLGEVDPKAVKAFAAGWAKLGASASQYGALLSGFRSAALDAQGDGFWARAQIGAIRNNLFSGVEGSNVLASLGKMFGGSVSEGTSEIRKVTGLPPELVQLFGR